MTPLRHSHMLFGLRAGSVFLLFALVAGCGGSKKLGEVSGTIKYKGEPVPGGKIYFYPKEGKSVEGGIKPDGSYTVSNIPPGENKVVIETESVKESMAKMPAPHTNVPEIPKDESAKAPPGKKPPTDVPGPSGASLMPKYVPIPIKYGKPDTTPEKMDVKKGNQKKDFTLAD